MTAGNGKLTRKLDPKLRVILAGGGAVNQIRAERSAPVRLRDIDEGIPPRREPQSRSTSADAHVETRPEVDEAKENDKKNVLVDVFLRLCDPKAERDASKWKDVEITCERDNLVTAMMPLSCLESVAADPSVNVVEIAERVDFFPPFELTTATAPLASEHARVGRALAPERGDGVIIGIIDVGGFDFAHPEFLKSGKTRFLEIWDQAGDTRAPPEEFGYGARITREHMQRAIDHAETHRGLPATLLEPQSLRMRSSHATHVASIAAGRHGVCPEADIVGVSIALPTEDVDRRVSFYDSTRLAHAVDYVFEIGERYGKPVSVNISLGTNGHAHDGSSAINRWLEHALSTPGRSISVAAGNAGQDQPLSRGDLGFIEGRVHSGGRIPAAGLSRDLEWIVVGFGLGDLSENELEIWYSMQDRFAIEIKPPDSDRWIGPFEPGEFVKNEQLESGTLVSVFNELYTPANGLNRIACYLSPFFDPGPVVGVRSGTWIVRLHGRDIRDGTYHAWIERDDPRRFRAVGVEAGWAFPSFLSRRTAVDSHTVNSLASAHAVIAVANLDEANERVHVTSSQGPTRDGRPKPEVAAPGTGVIGANGFGVRDGNTLREPWVRMTGTSMASPYVAGVVGLMLGVDPDLTAAQIAGIVRRSAKPLPGSSFEWQDDAGFGVIDPARCLEEVRRINELRERGDRVPEEPT